MKKIKKILIKMFLSVRKFIDKLIFFPISKVIYFIGSRFDRPGKIFEKLLSNTSALLFISLFPFPHH